MKQHRWACHKTVRESSWADSSWLNFQYHVIFFALNEIKPAAEWFRTGLTLWGAPSRICFEYVPVLLADCSNSFASNFLNAFAFVWFENVALEKSGRIYGAWCCGFVWCRIFSRETWLFIFRFVVFGRKCTKLLVLQYIELEPKWWLSFHGNDLNSQRMHAAMRLKRAEARGTVPNGVFPDHLS